MQRHHCLENDRCNQGLGVDGKPVLHVVFGVSAAGSLRQAFKVLGQAAQMIGCLDDLSFGPSTDATQRRAMPA